MKKVCIVMGSDSDLKVMEGAVDRLREFGVPFEVRVVSAHRTPAAAEQLAQRKQNGRRRSRQSFRKKSGGERT